MVLFMGDVARSPRSRACPPARKHRKQAALQPPPAPRSSPPRGCLSGWTILKDISPEWLWFVPALQPWGECAERRAGWVHGLRCVVHSAKPVGACMRLTRARWRAVHYIPVRWNGADEVNHVVKWLRQNDGIARTVAMNAKHFARSHLNDEGRLCYIKASARRERARAHEAACTSAATRSTLILLLLVLPPIAGAV